MIFRLLLLLLLFFGAANSTVLVEFGGIKGAADKELKSMVNKLGSIGFTAVGKNEHIETHYYNTFKEKNLDMINFYTVVDMDIMRELLIKNPNFGAYAPFNLLAYKTQDKKENTTWFGHLDSTLMLNIIGEKDKATRDKFKTMVSKLDKYVKKEMKPTTNKTLKFTNSLPTQPLLKMVKKFEGVDDLEEYIESFIMEHDSAFTRHKFVIAGFLDFKLEYEDKEQPFEEYDAYWMSSLCHFSFSNAVFNHGDPQAGVYAPCSIFFYIPKGKNELHVGYSTVENWINTTGIKDKQKIKYMKKVADEVVEVFEELGFALEVGTGGKSAKATMSKRDLANEIDELKAMIKALATDIKELKKKKPQEAVTPSKPIAVVLPKKDFKGAKLTIGGSAPKNLTAYYVANPQTVEGLKAKLSANGFTVLSTYEPLKGKTIVTITNKELQATNSYGAVLNILINGTDELKVQNPSYLGAAYLQKDFKYGQFSSTLTSLQAVLGDMYIVKDVTEFDDLEDYNFMMGLPHFDDVIEVSSNAILPSNKKYIVYSLKLPNGSTLVGHKLTKRTNKFLAKIDSTDKVGLLPYQSMISGKKAVILDPKFYLALSLPLLSMSDFMKIATAPDMIEKDIKKSYK